MNGYREPTGEVYQNTSQNSFTWYHKEVKPYQIFGRCDGIPFIASPYIAPKTGFIPMFVRNSEKKWMFEHPGKFVNLICNAFRSKQITLYNWTKTVNARAVAYLEAEQKRTKAEEKKVIRQSAENRDTAVHKPAKHTNAFRGKDPTVSYEYVDVSRKHYGTEIDFGGYFKPMNAMTASYMDGVH